MAISSQLHPGFVQEILNIVSEAALEGAMNTPAVLQQSAIASGIAPTGTVAANGAFTSGTAFAVTYSAGLWLFFPAGAVFSGSAAGSYWTVMSSTTVGTIFNNLKQAQNQLPGVLVPVVDAGPGAFTGAGTVNKTLMSFNLLGGKLGAHGQLRINTEYTYNTTAGNKAFILTLGATTLSNVGRTSAGGRDSITSRLRARGSQSLNHWYFASEGTGAVGASQLYTNLDLSVDQTFAFTCTLAAATDIAILDSYSIEFLPGPP
jgi:hypothetical protein